MLDVPGIMQALASFSAQRPGGLSPWALREDALAASLQSVRALRGQAAGVNAASAITMSRRGSSIGGGSYATRIGNIGIVPVIGPLVSRMSYSAWSYDEVVRDLRIMGQMPEIKAVLLDVDSPGGMVANVQSVPEEIARLRQSKPVTAFVNGMGASAAYWISAAADEVVADPTALVGSVGALIRYVDMEGVLTRLGANVVEAVAQQSPNKRLARDSEEGLAELQAIVDDAGEMFLASLSASRGVSRETILEQYGQGLVFPASEALQRGLVDRIASLEDVLSDLAARQSITLVAASATAQSIDHKEKPVDATIETLRAEHPQLLQAIESAAFERGAAAENARLIGIDEQAAGLSGHADLIRAMKADRKTTPAEAAMQILAAEKKNLAERGAALRSLDAAAAGVESLPSGNVTGAAPPVAQTPEGWTEEWNGSSALQQEYPTAGAYVAVMKRKVA